MAMTPIPALDRTSATFKADVDTFFTTRIPTFVTEANALETNVVAKEATASAAATNATTQVGLAAAQVTLATTQATNAAASATAAAASSNATIWVSGTTYAVGDVRFSPINFFSYRRKVGGAGTTDPSADATNWALATPSPKILISSRTTNTILGASDNETMIDITSGTFTQTFTAAATLGAGWWCYIRNSGTGDITLDPNASELIDGVTTGLLKPGMTLLIQCDGTSFNAMRIGSGVALTVLTSGTSWVCPLGCRVAEIICVGGGGGPNTSNSATGGGGGTAIKMVKLQPGTSYSYTIGAAGIGAGAGGNTTFTAGVVITGNGGSSGFPGGGGTAVNGDINVNGGYGTTAGGSSLYGLGASAGSGQATGYGGGGAFQGSAQAATQGAIFIKY